MSFSRRRFFEQSGLLAASTLATSDLIASAAGSKRPRAGTRPKHIIHLVSDGMSLGTLTCADHLSRLVRHRGLTWMDLVGNPAAGVALVNMRSLNSLVTDSAAASSSWGSGSRVKNGALNVLPDGRELRPLCSVFGDASWARGLVTTTEITHATPAGFAANVSDRGTADTIAQQYLERRVDVLLGGGSDYFNPAKRKDKADLFAEYGTRGYAVLRTRSDLKQARSNGRVLGTFATGHLPFSLDRSASPTLTETVPTLAEMAGFALERLSRHPHFLLQVEGGRVDHGAHASDAAAALYDQLAFDEALEVCLQFQKQEPGTLIVITTDHSTANLGLNGMGGSYENSPKLFANLLNVRQSFSVLQGELSKAIGSEGVMGIKLRRDSGSRIVYSIPPEVLQRVVQAATGYEVPRSKAELFSRYAAGEQELLFDAMDSLSAQLGQLMGNYLGIGWTGSAHTADYVPLVAIGPGSERFQGFLQNTQVFGHYVDMAGVKFCNPSLPLLAECGPTADEAEGCV